MAMMRQPRAETTTHPCQISAPNNEIAAGMIAHSSPRLLYGRTAKVQRTRHKVTATGIRARRKTIVSGSLDKDAASVMVLTIRLSGARYPRHQAMALYRHVVPSSDKRSCSARPLEPLVRSYVITFAARYRVMDPPGFGVMDPPCMGYRRSRGW